MRREEDDWTEKGVLEDYERAGPKDPKWDDAVRAMLRLYHKRGLSRNDVVEVRASLKHLIEELNCTDPLVWYYYGRRCDLDGGVANERRAIKAYGRAIDLFLQSKYSDFRKVLALSRGLNLIVRLQLMSNETLRNDNLKLLAKLKEIYPAAMRQSQIPPRFALELARDIVNIRVAAGEDREGIVNDMLVSLDKAYPNGSVPLIFAGDQYVKYAWEARGGGWANTVKEEGWKLMRERLNIAEKLLTDAANRDPNDSWAATVMITVELGQGQGRDRMERWFQRAIAANLGNFSNIVGNSPYAAKLWYLQPRWYGSALETIQFGRECVATQLSG